MSEFDSLSDSDWLDISSGRDSDVESLLSGDSDRDELSSRPHSRRSSISIGSSRDGEIDAWEGFIEESGDEAVRRNVLSIVPQAPYAADLSESAATAILNEDDNEHEEDERVKEALDQSLMSTLSASRSSSGSAHSLRDLRLSFPDPLTSSLNELNRTDDEVTSDAPEDNVDSNDDEDVPDAQAVVETPVTEKEPAPVAPVKPEAHNFAHDCDAGDITADFEVYLYGSTPIENKYAFVEDLLKKALDGVNCTAHCCASHGNSTRTYFRVQRQLGSDLILTDRIYFEDRTNLSDYAQISLLKDRPKRPSLAILYLPSQVTALPEHTLYLPVFYQTGEEQLQDELDARKIWASLGIPANKLARLTKDPEEPILDAREIGTVSPIRARGLLRRMISEGKKRPNRSVSDNIRPVHAVTLFALMSLVVGCAMSPGFRKSSHTPTPTVPSISTTAFGWGIFGQVNETSSFATTGKINTPVLTSAQREVSLSVFHPGTTSLSSIPKAQTSLSTIPATQELTKVAPTTPVEQIASTSAVTLEAMDSKGEVIVRPTTQLSQTIDQMQTPAVFTPSKVDLPITSKTTSLNLVVESLSQALDFRVKSLRTDLDDLVCALDDLGRAIRRQSKSRVAQSKGKAKEIRAEFTSKVMYRHERARGRAKELKKRGEEMLSSASEQIRDRTTIAKKRAQDIRKTIADSDAWRDLTSTGSEVWKAYQSAQMEWASKLQENSKGAGKGGTGAKSGKHGKSSRATHKKVQGQCREATYARRFEVGGIFHFA